MTSNFIDDLRAVIADGRTNGAVNSDESYDEAVDRLRSARRPVADHLIVAEVARARAAYGNEIAAAIAAQDDSQGLVAFFLFEEGDVERGRRPAEDTTRLVKSYLSAWSEGLESRLKGGLALRTDLEDEVEQELIRH